MSSQPLFFYLWAVCTKLQTAYFFTLSKLKKLDSPDRAAQYEQLLRELPVGLSEWAVHPGLNTSELLAIEGDSKHVRQSDYEFLMSPAAQKIVQEEGIILLDYRPLQAVWNATLGT